MITKHAMDSDVTAMARVMYALRRETPGDKLAIRILQAATSAQNAYRKTGIQHRDYGSGSIMAAAFAIGRQMGIYGVPPDPPLDNIEYCRTVAKAYTILADWTASAEAKE